MTLRSPPPEVPVEWLTVLLRLEGEVKVTNTTLMEVKAALVRIEQTVSTNSQRIAALEKWRTETEARLSSVGWFGKVLTAILGGFVAVFGQAIAKKFGWG